MFKKKYVYTYIAIIFMLLAFITWFLRYFLYAPLFYSLNDFFWLSALIMLIGQITSNVEHGNFFFILCTTLSALGIIIEEYSQNFPSIFTTGTFDILDIYAYLVSVFFSIILVFIIRYILSSKD